MAIAEAPARTEPVALPEVTLLMATKPLRSDVERLRGEVVERSAFKTTRSLEACGWLVPVPHGVKLVTCGCGRRWVSQDAASRHACQAAESR